MNTYKKYSSNLGYNVNNWGPEMWMSLFCSIMGSYPFKVNYNNKEHIKIKSSFKCLFSSLRYTLPCCVCQESYRRYWKEMPIDDYLDGRIELMKWLYLIKDRVNKKLIYQESERFKIEYNLLKDKYKEKKITKEAYNAKIKILKKNILKTKKSPPFNSIIEYYENFRIEPIE